MVVVANGGSRLGQLERHREEAWLADTGHVEDRLSALQVLVRARGRPLQERERAARPSSSNDEPGIAIRNPVRVSLRRIAVDLLRIAATSCEQRPQADEMCLASARWPRTGLPRSSLSAASQRPQRISSSPKKRCIHIRNGVLAGCGVRARDSYRSRVAGALEVSVRHAPAAERERGIGLGRSRIALQFDRALHVRECPGRSTVVVDRPASGQRKYQRQRPSGRPRELDGSFCNLRRLLQIPTPDSERPCEESRASVT